MTYYKSCRLINYISKNISNKKWFTELSNDKICEILNEYYLKYEQKEILNNKEKGQLGEDKIENILKINNIPYVKTSTTPHSGDFICYNKIMIDSKNYKNNVTKEQIDKLLFDMNTRQIHNGIMIVFTDSIFKFELKHNIIILYVSSINDEFIWLYLEIFLNYINTIPNNYTDDILCIDHSINDSLKNFNNILLKLENMKNNLNLIINDLYNANIDLKNIITNSLFIKSSNNNYDNIYCHHIIKKIISNFTFNELSYNSEKIYINFDKITLLINYKKKNEALFYIMNIENKLSQDIYSNLFHLMTSFSINITNNQLIFTIKYDSDLIYIDEFIKLLNLIVYIK